MATQSTGTSAYGGNVLQDVHLDTFVEALTNRTGIVHPLGRPGNIPEKHGKVVRWQFYSTPSAISVANISGVGSASVSPNRLLRASPP